MSMDSFSPLLPSPPILLSSSNRFRPEIGAAALKAGGGAGSPVPHPSLSSPSSRQIPHPHHRARSSPLPHPHHQHQPQSQSHSQPRSQDQDGCVVLPPEDLSMSEWLDGTARHGSAEHQTGTRGGGRQHHRRPCSRRQHATRGTSGRGNSSSSSSKGSDGDSGIAALGLICHPPHPARPTCSYHHTRSFSLFFLPLLFTHACSRCWSSNSRSSVFPTPCSSRDGELVHACPRLGRAQHARLSGPHGRKRRS